MTLLMSLPSCLVALGPWKTYQAEAVRLWHQAHPGSTLTIHDMGELIDQAFGKAFTIPSIVNAFRRTGLWPVNRDVFTDAEFMATLPTASTEDSLESSRTRETASPEPGTSTAVSPQDIRPFPIASRRVGGSRRGRIKRLPVVLTSSPEKNKLEQAAAARQRPNPKQLEEADGEGDSDVDMDPLDMEERDGLLIDPMLPEYRPAQIKNGDFLLINVKGGGRRNTISYRYVAQALEAFDHEDPNWIRVQGYRSLDAAKTRFSEKPNDVFSVELDDVIGGLLVPQICIGRGLVYKFPGTVDVKEL